MNQQQQINSMAGGLSKVTATEFASKFSTKRDVWRFLANEVKWYLPRAETVTIWHLRDLARGKRAHILCSNVKVIHMPQYEGLTVEDLLVEARKSEAVMRALPSEEKEIKKLPRAYIGNLIYTIIGKDFADWVDARVTARNAKLKEERDLQIELDSEIEAIFKASTSIGGKCFFTLKILLFPDSNCVCP